MELSVEHDAETQRPRSGLGVSERGRTTVVTLWGDIDATLRDQASVVMATALARSGPVVVDAAHVTFLDSSGLAFILQLLRAGEEDGRPVVLRDPPALVLELFDLLGMAGRIPVEYTAV